jgi:hypothetical protein
MRRLIDRVVALTNRAFAYLMAGQRDQALADVNAALSLDPLEAQALYLRGVLKRMAKDDDLSSRRRTRCQWAESRSASI